MKKIIESIKNKKSKWIKMSTCFVALVVICALIMQSQATASAERQENLPPTITLEKTEMTKTLSTSGVVKSINTTNIYSTLSQPVKEIFVSVGDRVKAGDVLAQLDISKLENDLAQAELNLKSAENSAAEEIRANSNSITNAQTSLDSSRISLERQELNITNALNDLQEAEMNALEPFDSYAYDKAIEDARINRDRKAADVEIVEKDLHKARNNFDDYIYKNAINEAKTNLDRLKANNNFDETLYQNAINDAENNLGKKQDEKKSATDNYHDAVNSHEQAKAEAKDEAWENVINTQALMESAKQAVEDAESGLNKAVAELEKARQEFEASSGNVITDAQRVYDKAVKDLERAKNDAEKNAADNLEKAKNNLADAQRTYEKTLSDKERAIIDYIDSNGIKLESAQKMLDDSQNQLNSAKNSVKSSQNSLNQAKSKPATGSTNIEIQELNIEKLEKQIAEGVIIATADGVITEMNAGVGAVPNGILFVIEDVDNLYVSVNVKEHSLIDLKIGQQGIITTEATGDRMYGAEVTYISPKAVSSAGSTSVEFEVKANMDLSDMDVKIGMNAFLNIITDSKTDIYVIPLSAIVTNENGNFVYVLENNEQREIAVSVGLKTSTHAEIYSDGLYDGLTILAKPEDR